MHTVIETRAFLAAAAAARMTDEERERAVIEIAEKPRGDDLVKDTGGCRKVRVAGRGKGKSGGYRVITYFGGDDIPVFLLTVFSKGERSDLSRAERNDLAKLVKTLRSSLVGKVPQLRRQS
jgi:hypothetical protein